MIQAVIAYIVFYLILLSIVGLLIGTIYLIVKKF
jgi:hypothetical protein